MSKYLVLLGVLLLFGCQVDKTTYDIGGECGDTGALWVRLYDYCTTADITTTVRKFEFTDESQENPVELESEATEGAGVYIVYGVTLCDIPHSLEVKADSYQDVELGSLRPDKNYLQIPMYRLSNGAEYPDHLDENCE